MGDLSKDFDSSEFWCRCCRAYVKNEQLVYNLQKLRDRLNMPITVTSGTRCNAHNREVNGADTSAHLSGKAADITCQDMYSLLKYAMQLFKRVGIGPDYIHVDLDETKPQGIYWVYDSKRKRIHNEPA